MLRSRPAVPIIVLAAIALAMTIASPAAAKENMQATLDAPIPTGVPGGTMLDVGLTVIVQDADGDHPVEGSPIYLRLFGRDHATTWAMAGATGEPGYYIARIKVPDGGVRSVEVGMHGTSDLPIRLMSEPVVFGGITPTTAQLASPTLTPVRAPAVAAAPVAPAATVASTGAGSVADTGSTPVGPALVVLALLAAVGAVFAATRARRGARSGTASGRAVGG